jgi:predicted nucleic acid-binding protein
MRAFIDTSAIMAVLNASDRYHSWAKSAWQDLLIQDVQVICSNYVLVEAISILQNRFGLEAVRLLQNDIVPVLEIAWVDGNIHRQAVSAMLVANRRQLSLVDCVSFEIMRQLEITQVFTFDPHFAEQGFKVIPPTPISP